MTAKPWPTGPHAICTECGTPVEIDATRLRFVRHNFYCSDSCKLKAKVKRNQHRVKHTHCDHCGERLNHLSKGGTFDINKRFCNVTCASRWAHAQPEVLEKMFVAQQAGNERRWAREREKREQAGSTRSYAEMVVHDPFMAVYD